MTEENREIIEIDVLFVLSIKFIFISDVCENKSTELKKIRIVKVKVFIAGEYLLFSAEILNKIFLNIILK